MGNSNSSGGKLGSSEPLPAPLGVNTPTSGSQEPHPSLLFPPSPAAESFASQVGPGTGSEPHVHIHESPSESSTLNPGSIEDIHKKCKDVFPLAFEGGRLLVQKPLSSHFQIAHALTLGSPDMSGYKFQATYAGTKQFSPNEAYPILMGEVDASGSLNANIIHQFTRELRTRLVAQLEGFGKKTGGNAAQGTMEYFGRDYTATCTLANIDLKRSSGVMILQYLQAVGRVGSSQLPLDLGAELVYQRDARIPGGQIALISISGRLSGKDWVASGTLGGPGIHATFYQKASEQLQIGVEMDANLRLQDTTTTIGYQADLPKAGLVYKGSFDSNWTCCAMLEKKLQPLPFTLALSGKLNHKKGNFGVGIGLIIG
ncbi:unnamed protein product [Darwinula stevensoni]|uniref:Mitochondrial import receptor subunit TOM40 n=1 Tax=Darwinula stevensoni TaxID=69355 RepID=A0A7R8X0R0_9CRUS|nr:unnamed protein product [Darwinula stevensoni]CAG0881483.1 unnamed protein product [Darwinula stevensoni]